MSHWAPRQRIALGLGMALLQLLLLAPTVGIALKEIPDEGTVALQGLRILAGQVPHRDYFTQTPLGGDYWVAAWMALFGTGLLSLRAYFLLQMASAAAMIEFLACRLLPKGWSELPALTFALMAPFGWYVASQRWDAAWLNLLALLLIDRPLASGLAVGLAALTFHPSGAAAFAGIGLALLLQRQPRALFNFGWGVLIIWVPYLLWLQALGIVDLFLFDTLYFNLTTYVEAHRQGIDWSSFGPNFVAAADLGRQGFWGQASMVGGYALVDLMTYGAWLGATALATALSLRQGRKAHWPLLLTLGFLTLLELFRPNRYHFNFHRPFLGLVLVLLLKDWGRLGKGLAGIFCLAHLLVALGHLGSAFSYRYPVDLPRGRLYLRDPGRAQALAGIAQVNSQLPPGEKLFVFPDEPLLQWLLGRPPVTREVAAFPCFYSYSQFQAIRRDLQREGVENLLYVPLQMSPEAYPTLDLKHHRREEAWLVQYLSQGYRVLTQVGGVTFFRLKDR